MAEKNRPRGRRPVGTETAIAYRLAGAALCDPRTATKALRGEPLLPMVRQRLEIAARAIGVELPPERRP
jgi:hypothetical protein